MNGLRLVHSFTNISMRYQECDKTGYLKMLGQMPNKIDWSRVSEYENEDNTSGSQTLACSGDSCEIVDLV